MVSNWKCQQRVRNPAPLPSWRDAQCALTALNVRNYGLQKRVGSIRFLKRRLKWLWKNYIPNLAHWNMNHWSPCLESTFLIVCSGQGWGTSNIELVSDVETTLPWQSKFPGKYVSPFMSYWFQEVFCLSFPCSTHSGCRKCFGVIHQTSHSASKSCSIQREQENVSKKKQNARIKKRGELQHGPNHYKE